MITRFHATFCPFCNYKHDACSGVGNESSPKLGSVSVCYNCLEISLFNEDLSLRKPTTDELLDIYQDVPVGEIRRMLTKAKTETGTAK